MCHQLADYIPLHTYFNSHPVRSLLCHICSTRVGEKSHAEGRIVHCPVLSEDSHSQNVNVFYLHVTPFQCIQPTLLSLGVTSWFINFPFAVLPQAKAWNQQTCWNHPLQNNKIQVTITSVMILSSPGEPEWAAHWLPSLSLGFVTHETSFTYKPTARTVLSVRLHMHELSFILKS